MVKHGFRQWFPVGLGLVGGLAIAPPTWGQIVPDNTLPNPSIVPAGCTLCTIEGGTTQGANLFHSFSQFSVPAGGIAYFNNPAPIQNIITRVTGNLGSNINGLMQANDTANLFLMNPNGIVFGPNASLNIGGSFVATTANAMQLGNQGVFSASEPAAPPLLTVNPSAFLFNQLNQRAIQLNGSLMGVPAGRSLLLVGGNVSLQESTLFTPGGQIEVGGLAAPGRIELGLVDNSLQLQFPAEVPRADVFLRGNAALSRQSSLLVSGGGKITITANNVEMTESFLFGGLLAGGSVGSRAGDIIVNATGDVTLSQQSFIGGTIFENTTGDGGNIVVQARALTLKDGSFLSTGHAGIGKGGNIAITTQDTVSLSGVAANGSVSSIISSTLGGQGNAGSIQISTRQLLVEGGTISAFTNRLGNGGDITINARDAIVVKGVVIRSASSPEPIVSGGIQSFVGSDGIGNGGTITLSTPALNISNGGSISTDTLGNGNGGTITLLTPALNISNGSSIDTQTLGKGNSGDIVINARDVVLDGAVRSKIDNSSNIYNRSSGIKASTLSSQGGNGGNVRITAHTLSVLNGASIDASTSGQGNAGNISIFAQESVKVDGEAPDFFRLDGEDFSFYSAISAGVFPGEQVLGVGNAGTIDITTGILAVTNGASISTTLGGKGKGGNINIKACNAVIVSGSARDSDPSVIQSSVNARSVGASSFQGVGRGGDIVLTTDALRLSEDGRIQAGSLSPTGISGDIILNANTIGLDTRAIITTSTVNGTGGNITLNATDYVLMRRNSLISSSAVIDIPNSSNGGNIAINAPQGFLITAQQENNDIRANALTGRGGRVTVNAQGIYGFTPRSRAELVQLLGTSDSTQLDTRLLPTNDITAISQGNPDLSGVVTLNTLGLDPSKGLVALPTGLVDPANQLDRRCAPQSTYRASSFVITGTGGIPATPIDPLVQQNALMELVPLPNTEQAERGTQPQVNSRVQAAETVEVQGWVVDAQGTVWLVADVGAGSPQTSAIAPPNCARQTVTGE